MPRTKLHYGKPWIFDDGRVCVILSYRNSKELNAIVPMTNANTGNSAPPVIETVEALKQAYAQGQRNFSGVSLPETMLKATELKGADLSYADLSSTDLTEANLRGVDLSYALLRGADLSQADLRGASLIGTDLRESTLTAANLTDADYDPEETRFPNEFDPDQAGMRSDR